MIHSPLTGLAPALLPGPKGVLPAETGRVLLSLGPHARQERASKKRSLCRRRPPRCNFVPKFTTPSGKLIQKLREFCQSRGINFFSVTSDAPLEKLLLKQLREAEVWG